MSETTAETWTRVRKGLDERYRQQEETPWESQITVTKAGEWGESVDLPSSARQYALRAERVGFTVDSQMSITWHSDSYYAEDSKVDDELEKGAIKTPAHEEKHFGVLATLSGTARFVLDYDQVDGKNKFTGAHFVDMDTPHTFTKKVGVFEDWFSKYAPKEIKGGNK